MVTPLSRTAAPITPEPPPAASHRSNSLRSLALGWLTVLAVLLPALSAVWTVPGFMTQDGPTHVYNAWILACSFDPQSPYHAAFAVQWKPLPNWAGHLALAGLLHLVPAQTADRIMVSLTLLGFAGALVWLRWRVRGAEGMVGGSILAAMLALNFPWLLGFYGFLLGCCLFPITLGVWWVGRDALGPGRMLCLALLLVLGYFAHLVSLGLTVAALAVLAVLAPAPRGTGGWWMRRRTRLPRTAISCLPLAALGVVYLRLSRQGGPMHPVWENLSDPRSPLAWLARLGWVDPVTLVRKDSLPFTDSHHRLFFPFAPVLWLVAAGAVLALAALIGWWLRRSRDASPTGTISPREEVSESVRIRRAWLVVGLSLIVAGLAGPDSMGPGHGEYLPQRLELLGLAALVPSLDFKIGTRAGRIAGACLMAAVLLQTLVVWDYAAYSHRTAGQFSRAVEDAGRNQRIATVLIQIRNRFRCNPVLHADGWLGVGTGNILWSNYEARYYYFPVRFRPGLNHPNPRWFEDIARATDPEPTPKAVALWTEIMSRYHESIDRVVIWHHDPVIDAITERWYDVVHERGGLRILTRRDIKE